MILTNSVNVGSFVYCAVHQGPNKQSHYNNTGHGHCHLWSYIVSGSGHGTASETQDGPTVFSTDLVSGTLYDMRKIKDMYHHIKTFDEQMSFINFNPIPHTRNINVEVLKGPTTTEITAVDNRIVIVCITGPITANGKTLDDMQHAKLFPGKTAKLDLLINSVIALVTEDSDN